MTRAGIGAVAAVIGVFVLGEPFKPARAGATALILAGVAALKFA